MPRFAAAMHMHCSCPLNFRIVPATGDLAGIMGKLPFFVENWSVWAPGLDSQASWISWAAGNRLPNGDAIPDVSFLPAMLRRRLSRLSKMALKVAFECAGDYRDLCSVFCSQHGEIHRTESLLQSLAINESLSPTAFSLSVHNTASGLYSIASSDKSATKAIAAGSDTFSAGFIDALLCLKGYNCDRVLLVYADEVLPARYNKYEEPAAFPLSVALLLSEGSGKPLSYSLHLEPRAGDIAKEPQALQFLRFFLGGWNRFSMAGARQQYIWSRDESPLQ